MSSFSESKGLADANVLEMLGNFSPGHGRLKFWKILNTPKMFYFINIILFVYSFLWEIFFILFMFLFVHMKVFAFRYLTIEYIDRGNSYKFFVAFISFINNSSAFNKL